MLVPKEFGPAKRIWKCVWGSTLEDVGYKRHSSFSLCTVVRDEPRVQGSGTPLHHDCFPAGAPVLLRASFNAITDFGQRRGALYLYLEHKPKHQCRSMCCNV